MDNLLAIRAGGNVKRFHTRVMIKENLVSSHSWGVAVLLLEISPDCSKNLLVAALYHDVAEHVIGDFNTVTKWRFPELKHALEKAEEEVNRELSIVVPLLDYEKDTLKFADMVELILTCVQEYRLGNQEAGIIANRGLYYLDQYEWPENCTKYLPKVKLYVKETLV